MSARHDTEYGQRVERLMREMHMGRVSEDTATRMAFSLGANYGVESVGKTVAEIMARVQPPPIVIEAPHAAVLWRDLEAHANARREAHERTEAVIAAAGAVVDNRRGNVSEYIAAVDALCDAIAAFRKAGA